MPDLQTNDKPEQTQTPAPAPAPKKPAPRKSSKKKLVKRIIAIVVTLALLSSICFGVWFLVFRQVDELGEIYAEPSYIGSIQSSVQGSGYAAAKDNATITVPHPGVIDELLVGPNDTVYAGQPLFTMSSPAAEEAVEKARQAVADAQEGVTRAQQGVTDAERNVSTVEKNIPKAEKAVADAEKQVTAAEREVTKAQDHVTELTRELSDLKLQSSQLTITAPFSGKIIKVETYRAGDKLGKDVTLAILANDKKLRVTLYFSYAYEDQIQVGQSAQISVPAMMFTTTGKVEAIQKVNYITPEGGTYFQVALVFDNPGTLTEGMNATATLTSKDGTPIYPYIGGETAYYETREITTGDRSGPLVSSILAQHLDVTAGQTLAVLGPDDLNKEIEAKEEDIAAARQAVTDAQEAVTTAKEGVESAREGVTAAHEAVADAQRQIGVAQEAVVEAQKQVTAAEEALAKAEEDVGSLNATAPIDGTIISCTINEGSEVKGGDAVITISNTSTMVVTIQVDDRNIGFISLGSMIELSRWDGSIYMGTVTNISYGGDQSGMGGMGMGSSSGFPVTLEVDNYDGSLYPGADLSYSFVTSQSENCILVQTIAVKSVLDAEGNRQTVVFVQRDERPDNAIDLDPSITGVPTPEEGYWPVLVETGLSDAKQVEIKSGIEEMDMVFISYTDPNRSSGGIMYG